MQTSSRFIRIRPSARLVVVAVTFAMLLAACSSDGSGDDDVLAGAASFGGNETACVSTVLANEANDQALMAQGADCFVSQTEAGEPVVWDLSRPTVEGDPIFSRYVFDGTDIWILGDTRADTFGSGTVSSVRCAGIERTAWEPLGIDCADDDSYGFDGFPEAE